MAPPSRAACETQRGSNCETDDGRHARDELDEVPKIDMDALLVTAAPAAVMVGISAGFWPQLVASRSLVTRASSSGESPCLHAQFGIRAHFSPRLNELHKPILMERFAGELGSEPADADDESTGAAPGVVGAFPSCALLA